MATQATRIRFLRRQRFEVDDLGDVSTPFYVSGSWAMTRLASMPVVERRLEMRRFLKVAFVQVLVAGLAGIRSNVLG